MDPRFCLTKTDVFSVIDVVIHFNDHSLEQEYDYKTICLAIDCKYTEKLVSKVLNRRPWLRVVHSLDIMSDSDIDLQWGEYEHLFWPNLLKNKCWGSSYCIRKGLSRKAQLSIYTQKFSYKYPQSALAGAVPKTLILDLWEAIEGGTNDFGVRMKLKDRIEWALVDAKEFIESSKHNLFILKPSATNKGAECFVLRNYTDLRNSVLEWTDIREWVLQYYILNPLLIENRKFHFRVYVLTVGCITVYVNEEVLVLCAQNDYMEDDVSDLSRHLTNTAIQSENLDFREEECVRLLRDLNSIFAAVNNKSFSEYVLDQISAITADLFRAYKGEFSVFQPLPNCFELYGMDFMMDTSMNVWLLEANPGPDFKQTGNKLQRVIEHLIESTTKVVIDSKLCSIDDDITIPSDFTLRKVYEEDWGGGSRDVNMQFF